MRKIVIANQKGGVGKTTTAVNLASGLAFSGKRTLLLDMDPQANATFALIGLKQPAATMYQFLVSDDYSLKRVILPTAQTNLHLLPSDINLAAAESELIAAMDGRTRLSAKLSHELDPAAYDFVVIDAPPSLGMLTINALTTATEIIVPVAPSIFGLQGISKLEDTIERVRKHLYCPELHISGVVLTFQDSTNVARDTHRLVEKHFGSRLFKTAIPKNVKLEEAHSRAQSIYVYDVESSGAQAYAKFVEEVIAYEEVMVYG
jgi:chromosome partitioning protein